MRMILAVTYLTLGISGLAHAQQMSPTGFKMAQTQLNDAAKGQCYQGCQDVWNRCPPPRGQGTQCMENLNTCQRACNAK